MYSNGNGLNSGAQVNYENYNAVNVSIVLFINYE